MRNKYSYSLEPNTLLRVKGSAHRENRDMGTAQCPARQIYDTLRSGGRDAEEGEGARDKQRHSLCLSWEHRHLAQFAQCRSSLPLNCFFSPLPLSRALVPVFEEEGWLMAGTQKGGLGRRAGDDRRGRRWRRSPNLRPCPSRTRLGPSNACSARYCPGAWFSFVFLPFSLRPRTQYYSFCSYLMFISCEV